MRISLEKKNGIFWILQFLGWGALSFFPVLVLKELSFEFMVFSVLSSLVTGIISTNLLRMYLKREITFDGFGAKDVIKILVSVLICGILYAGMNFGFGYLYGRYAPFKTELDLKLLSGYNSYWLITFNSIIIIFGWVICYLVIKLLLKLNADRIDRLELNANLKQAQLNTLKGQINPHFMFNSLNNIRGLMLEDVERSREMLTKLSEMLRYSLVKDNVNAIILQEELEMIDNYIALSKIQFEERLSFIKNIDPATLQLPIPPMIVQLLVENAVKHGISNLRDGGKIWLTTEIVDQRLVISVRNSGRLSISKDSTQLGLKNIKQRLRLLYGGNSSFVLEEKDGEVIAIIKIPLA
ncbi:MAG: histidine kinase [Sediminicola sp.]|mgnify:CR=1 FL=1|tara:strand:+ start:86280 stop:87338 length:1059 start_codon:yes stop_codon:yes gene_type:complete